MNFGMIMWNLNMVRMQNFFYMDTDRFIFHVKTEGVYKVLQKMLKNDLTLGLKFVGLRAKKFSYLKDNNDDDKKAKGTKKCVITRKLESKDY